MGLGLKGLIKAVYPALWCRASLRLDSLISVPQISAYPSRQLQKVLPPNSCLQMSTIFNAYTQEFSPTPTHKKVG